MRKIVNSICLTMIAYCIISCGPRMLEREEIIDQYGLEVINYFYETVFHLDRGGGIRDEATRWEGDIRVSLHGEMLENDSAIVIEALSEINSLDLPISMRLVSDSTDSNVRVFFGDAAWVAERLVLDSVVTLGVVVVGDDAGAIGWARVGILNNPKMYSQTNGDYASILRRATILEEIAQVLGTGGDSYTYHNSLFFEGAGRATKLSGIDSRTIEFLYDRRIFPERIMRSNFEKKYADLIYNRITREKLYSMTQEYGLERHDLDSLREMVFGSRSGERFVKFPRTAFLKLSGDSSRADAEFCRALIARLNTITPWFQLELVEDHRIWNALPALTIHYEEGKEYKGVTNTQVGLSTMEMMFTYRISGDIWMRFHNPKKELVPYHKAMSFHHEALTRAIFKALGLSTHDRILVNATTDSLEIGRTYEVYFRLLYDPRFPSGISKADFEKLLEGID